MSYREAILAKLGDDSAVPPFPAIITRLNQLLDDMDTTTEQIAEIIQLDPLLAGRVLRLANSAAMGAASQVASIPRAVMSIGMKEIRDMVTALSVLKTFTSEGKLRMEALWRHSLTVAFAARIVEAHASNIKEPSGLTYTAGLMHDIGILFLDQVVPDLYRQIQQKRQEAPLHRLEEEILGIDHQEVGAQILQLWKLPESIVQAVRYHHDPGLAPRSAGLLPKIIHLANFICNNQGAGNRMDRFPSQFSESAWFDIGLAVDEIPRLIEEVNAQTARATAVLATAMSL